ncbi:MAG TPA: GNAT family N-acetyltransferase [Chloroflexia bacterium]|nr:GNAT family N-acetyltransferase [Chloroflexia bacterium]
MYFERSKDNYLISTNPEKLDIDTIHNFLSHSYWAENIPREIVVRSIKHSLCFGIYDRDKQVGFARVISDLTTYAYIGDVFVLEEYRGRGLSKWLMSSIMEHPDLQGLRRWGLATRDAHGLYRQFGFQGLKNPDRYMEIARPDIYKQNSSGTV